MNTHISTAALRSRTSKKSQVVYSTTIFKGLKFAGITYKIQLNTKVRFIGNNLHSSEWFYKLVSKIKAVISSKKNRASDYFTCEFNYNGEDNSAIANCKDGNDLQFNSNQRIPLFI